VNKELEEFRDFLINIFKDNWNETFAARDVECADWVEFDNHWIDLMKSIIDMIPKDVLARSLTAVRFLELNRGIIWNFFGTMVGAYEVTIRELRFWFEAMLQAYLTDLKGGVKYLSKRVAKLHGSALIEKCGFDNVYEQELKRIYKELCGFVHPSLEELDLGLIDDRVTFSYNETKFNITRRVHRDVYDAILFIAMNIFPKAAKDYKCKHLVVKSLGEMDCKLSVRYLEQLLNRE
jgi:hypothetical protein